MPELFSESYRDKCLWVFFFFNSKWSMTWNVGCDHRLYVPLGVDARLISLFTFPINIIIQAMNGL